MENNYCVYKHTCPNGKVYIGITGASPKRRWENGNGYKTQVFYRAIKKYGWDSIKHEILYSGLSLQEANELEIKLINDLKSNNPNFGYNIQNGGDATGKHSDETKKKISESHKGKKMVFTDEHRKNLSEAAKGKVFTDEHRKHISESHKGKGRNNDKTYCSKSVLCIETMKIYKSIAEAGRVTGISKDMISRVCRKVAKTAGGLHWRYLNE